MNQQAQIQAQYVNPRKDKRPPTIKDSSGTYYTISDAAYQMLAPYQGQVGNIQYWTNEKGYHQATHWNGQELPKDQRGGPPQQVAQTLPPLAAPNMQTTPMAQAAGFGTMTVTPPLPTVTNVVQSTPGMTLPNDKGLDIFLTGVVQQAMSTGKFGANDIKTLALAARDAWKAAHSAEALAPMPDGRPAPPSNDDIDF